MDGLDFIVVPRVCWVGYCLYLIAVLDGFSCFTASMMFASCSLDKHVFLVPGFLVHSYLTLRRGYR